MTKYNVRMKIEVDERGEWNTKEIEEMIREAINHELVPDIPDRHFLWQFLLSIEEIFVKKCAAKKNGRR